MSDAPTDRTAPRPLSSLSERDVATVVELPEDEPVDRRLRELGFVPGTPVVVGAAAPMGDPRVYELRGTRLSLRASEASRILVKLRGSE